MQWQLQTMHLQSQTMHWAFMDALTGVGGVLFGGRFIFLMSLCAPKALLEASAAVIDDALGVMDALAVLDGRRSTGVPFVTELTRPQPLECWNETM